MNRCNGNERNFSIEVNEVVRLMFQDIPMSNMHIIIKPRGLGLA